MNDLAEFLLARIADDEAGAKACGEAGDTTALSWGAYAEPGMSERMDKVHDHVARWDSARVLAECEAGRRLVGHFLEISNLTGIEGEALTYNRGLIAGFVFAMRYRALPYADHPDYREEWRP